jgi:carboxypeptidase Q
MGMRMGTKLRATVVASAVAASALLLAAPTSASAQRLANDNPVLQSIWDEAMNNSDLERLGQALLDSIGPRLTASPGMERAQQWALAQFES